MYIGALPVRDGKEEVKGVEGKSEREREGRGRSRDHDPLQKRRSQKQKVDPWCTLHARRPRYDYGRAERLLEAEEAPL